MNAQIASFSRTTRHRSAWIRALAATTLLVVPVALQAQQEADDAATRTEEIKAKTDLIKAQTDYEKARQDRTAQTVAPFTALAGEGKTELGDGAGKMEAWLLMSGVLNDSAAKIVAELDKADAQRKVILLVDTETVDFTPLFAARQQAASVSRQLGEALTRAPACTPRPGAPVRTPGPAPSRVPVLSAIGALGSLLQSDTSVSGIEIDASARLLAMSVAQKLGGRAVLPASLSLPPSEGSSFQKELAGIEVTQTRASARQACLTAGGNKDQVTTQGLALLAAALSRHAAMITALSAAADGTEAPLITVLKLDWLADGKPLLLRLFIDQAGGTVITRKNIWTAFGAPAIGVSGGLVASFNATDPATGRIVSAGVIACRTRLASLRSVQKTDTAGSCRTITAE